MFKVENSTINNCFSIFTDCGNKYYVSLNETAPKSGVWLINFRLVDGIASSKEVFITLKTLWINLKKIMIDKNINSVFGYIDGEDREERDKKTKVFSRWVDYPFEVHVDNSPEIRIRGKSSPIYLDTNFFHIKRIPGSINESIQEPEKKEEIVAVENSKNSFTLEIKFCFNCGIENKSFKFCPNCGTNLQQS